MISNSIVRLIFRYSFLFILVLVMIFAVYAVQNGFDRLRTLIPLIALAVVYNLFVESLIPFGRTQNKRPYGRDFVFTIFNIFITANLRGFELRSEDIANDNLIFQFILI
jgi:dolichol kinase